MKPERAKALGRHLCKTVLEPYQVKGAKFTAASKYTLLAMDAGLGKTLTSLTAWLLNGGGPLVVVCPASLVLNWRMEIDKWTKGKFRISTFYKGREVHRVWDTEIVIVSFDLGTIEEGLFEWAQTVIIDEAHEIKTMTTKRTTFYHKNVYENSVPNVYLLTGTPIQNRVPEYYSLLCLLHYKEGAVSDFLTRFPDQETFNDYFSWRKEYKIEVKGRRVKIVNWSGYKNPEELMAYLKPFYYRVKFDDVENLKPIVFKDILISEAKDESLLKEFEQWSKTFDDETSATGKYKQKAAVRMVPFTVAYAKDLIAQGNKVVVFSDYKESASLIAEKLGTVALSSSVSGSERGKYVVEFQAGKHEALVGTLGAMGTGHNMTAAHHLIINDESWKWGLMVQVYARIHRKGQTKTCNVHRMYGSPQSLKISQKLREKGKTISKVT